MKSHHYHTRHALRMQQLREKQARNFGSVVMGLFFFVVIGTAFAASVGGV